MYVCECVCQGVYVCMYVNVFVKVCMYVCECVCLSRCVCMYVNVFVKVCMYIYECVCMCGWMVNLNICVYCVCGGLIWTAKMCVCLGVMSSAAGA
jgi:hypothetical protein